MAAAAELWCVVLCSCLTVLQTAAADIHSTEKAGKYFVILVPCISATLFPNPKFIVHLLEYLSNAKHGV
jgi:hypothetical protein